MVAADQLLTPTTVLLFLMLLIVLGVWLLGCLPRGQALGVSLFPCSSNTLLQPR